MARGSSESNKNVFYVQAKQMKAGLEEWPYFELKQGRSGNYTVAEPAQFLTGFVTKIEKVDKEAEIAGAKKRVRGVKFELSDPTSGEIYLIEMPYSNASRSLLNRMYTLGDFKTEVKISLYRDAGKYAGISLKKRVNNDFEKVDISFGYNEHIAPRIKAVELNGAQHKDYTLVDAFFDELLDKKLVNFEKADVTMLPVENTIPKSDSSSAPETDWDSSDLPF